MGFKHLRYYSHYFDSELLINNSNGTMIGSINKKGTHHSNGKKADNLRYNNYSRKMLKRNGDYKYYTPEALDKFFFLGIQLV